MCSYGDDFTIICDSDQNTDIFSLDDGTRFFGTSPGGVEDFDTTLRKCYTRGEVHKCMICYIYYIVLQLDILQAMRYVLRLLLALSQIFIGKPSA